MQALLSQLGGAGGAGGFQQGPPPLCEFRAGRMHYDGRMVTPDRAKGWIRITRDPLQPGMVTFAFLDETKQNTIESLILFPDLAKFEKVKQSSDRVYLLEVQPEPRRLFFWMQDADKENDADRCKKCHNALNGIAEAPAAGAQANGTAAAQAAPPSRQ
eukprot:Macronucleus_6198.p1 GENE.Macronucleus_6198~~Macronucleus_6198.p1  ORF type:complete len:158 (+),score=36.38 Macronucleus_6198:1-474(+)